MTLDQPDTTNIEHALKSMFSVLESRSTTFPTGPSTPMSSGAMSAKTKLPFVVQPVRLRNSGKKSIKTKLPFISIKDPHDVYDVGSNKD